MRSLLVKKYIGVTAALWTVVLIGFFLKDAVHLKQTIQDLATAEAVAYFNKDKAARMWAASHGGVYVPVTEATPPNPYLVHIPDRDVLTPTGKHLTLMNPAYMAREMMTHYAEFFGVRSHLTSLSYFRTETAPDEWEIQALLSFEDGHPEVREITDLDGESFLRLMRPVRTQENCLKCHRHQGYSVGDIRGGVSVSVPMKPYLAVWRKSITSDIASFGLLWVLGLGGLFFFSGRFSKPLQELEKTEVSLRVSQENYRILVENSLTGIYVIQDNTIVFANSEFARIHGYELNEVIGMDNLSLVHPDDRPAVMERVQSRYEAGPQTDPFRVRGLTKSGNTVYVQRRNALTSYNGQPAVIGNEIDVTSQMVAESELAASEKQLQRLADGLIELRENEREQFAKDIHENIAQCLSAIKFQVESAAKVKPAELHSQASEALKPIVLDVQHTLSEIRKMTRRYPIGMDHLGIVKSITYLCDQTVAKCPSLCIEKVFEVSESDIPESLKIIIFRMAEQMLYSISRQPDAAVRIGLELISERIVFYVKTNVSAADLNGSSLEGFLQGELAMIALKRRIEKFGGSFLVLSGHAKETVLIATWDIYCKYPCDSARLPS